jgi:hypothetical protein
VRGLKQLLAFLLAAAMLWPAVASAVDLTSFKTDDQDKKLRLEFNFSEAVEAQVVNNYASNFVDIGIAGLKVPRNLARKDHEPDNEDTSQFYRYTRFMEVDGEQHIRIYLGKYADPSDVQVVPLDDLIEVEMVKPFWKLPPEEAVTSESAEAEGFIPDEEESEDEGAAAEDEDAEQFPTGLRESTGSTAAPGGEPEAGEAESAETEETNGLASVAAGADEQVEDAESQPAAGEGSDSAETAAGDEAQPADSGLDSGEFYGETSLRDLSNDESSGESAVSTTANGAELQPVRSLTQPPSYQQFDLSDVAVAQVQLRNLPFNEALMELVAGSGFNVIVGSEVSNEVMTLDFRQRELSLKRALDLLCMAYDLTYIVEDDAIIINGK